MLDGMVDQYDQISSSSKTELDPLTHRPLEVTEVSLVIN